MLKNDMLGGLAKIEADVVIFGSNSDMNVTRCAPLWECTMTPRELQIYAMECAHQWAEEDGLGEVVVYVVDFREGPKD